MGGGQGRTGEGAEGAAFEEREGNFEAQHEETRLTAQHVEFSQRARFGLAAISAHVEMEFGSDVEERVMARIDAAIAMFARFPSVGHRRSDITSDQSVRFWSVGPTVIAYRNEGQRVLVLFIERAETDWMGKFDVSSE